MVGEECAETAGTGIPKDGSAVGRRPELEDGAWTRSSDGAPLGVLFFDGDCRGSDSQSEADGGEGELHFGGVDEDCFVVECFKEWLLQSIHYGMHENCPTFIYRYNYCTLVSAVIPPFTAAFNIIN